MMPQKEENEGDLVGALKLNKEKYSAMHSLAVQHHAALQLAKKRVDDAKNRKKKLSIMDSRIKELMVIEGKLLKAKEELFKENGALYTELDGNQEVTGSAVEDLRLNEVIGGLKSFFEEGQNENITQRSLRLQRQKEGNAGDLVGTLKHIKEKYNAMHALAVENHAALQLAKKRVDDTENMKKKLSIMESRIKELIWIEGKLFKAKEELHKEIKVLYTKLDRNQGVIGSAIENLPLDEEIQGLKSFFEEGENRKHYRAYVEIAKKDGCQDEGC